MCIVVSALADHRESLLNLAQAALNESETVCKKLAGGIFSNLLAIKKLLSDDEVSVS